MEHREYDGSATLLNRVRRLPSLCESGFEDFQVAHRKSLVTVCQLAAGPPARLADLDAVWPLDWMAELGSLPADLFGPARYPKTNAWMARWRAEIKAVKKKVPTLSGEDAARAILAGAKAPTTVETGDPTALHEGTDVLLWPTDTGAKHRDRGRLVGLTKDEVVIAVKTKIDPSKEIHLHAP